MPFRAYNHLIKSKQCVEPLRNDRSPGGGKGGCVMTVVRRVLLCRMLEKMKGNECYWESTGLSIESTFQGNALAERQDLDREKGVATKQTERM